LAGQRLIAFPIPVIRLARSVSGEPDPNPSFTNDRYRKPCLPSYFDYIEQLAGEKWGNSAETPFGWGAF
jgi:hypothetical protein